MVLTENLLIPRFLVLEDWPGRPQGFYNVKDIITDDGENACTDQNNNVLALIDFKKYPLLFRELHWSEYRKEDQMPEYIKCPDGEVYKVAKWGKDVIGRLIPVNEIDEKSKSNAFSSITWHFHKDKILPATEIEYIQYLNQAEHGK